MATLGSNQFSGGLMKPLMVVATVFVFRDITITGPPHHRRGATTHTDLRDVQESFTSPA